MSGIYVSYYYTKTNVGLNTPITVLRTIIYLFITLLFMPIIDFFVSIWNCDENGNHYYFGNSLVCWKGIHIVLTIFSIISLLLFLLISGLLTVTFYECRTTSNDPMARANGRSNFLMMVY